MNTKTSARQKLADRIAAMSTDQLLAGHGHIAKMDRPDKHHRLVSAMISDEIETRLGLTDALDEIFSDVDYAGTYHDALLAAIVATEAATGQVLA